jgi:hypothetical protein
MIIGQTDLSLYTELTQKESCQGYYFVDNIFEKQNLTILFILEDGPWAISYFLLLQHATGKVPGTCFFYFSQRNSMRFLQCCGSGIRYFFDLWIRIRDTFLPSINVLS